jgi:glycine oxidase
MTAESTPEILIIGGGVIGLTTAYYLARENVSVAVIDKGDLGQEASWAGAGILSSGNPKRAKSPMGLLRALGVAMHAELAAELRDRTGIDNGYFRCGGIELRRSEEALEKRRIENLVHEERGEGNNCEVLDSKQLREIEPSLSPSLPGAVYFPEMAQVRNPRHIKALIAACGSSGVRLMPGRPVYGWERDGDRITGALSADGALQAERFVVAAGSWSDMLLQMAGWRCQVRPIRGQIAMLHTSPPLLRRILLSGAEYLVPRPDGRVLVGSTEEDVGFDKRTTAEAIQDLLRLAIGLAPGLAHAQVERCWAGLRPGSPDGKPFIGLVPGCRNLFAATGHFRSGIQLSPSTGLVMTELLTGRTPSVVVEAFRLDREV